VVLCDVETGKRVEDSGVDNEHSGCWRQTHVSQVTAGESRKEERQLQRWTDNGREYAGCRSAGETLREGEKNFGGSLEKNRPLTEKEEQGEGMSTGV